MDAAILLRLADLSLRLQYASNIAGLTTFAANMAATLKTEPVTITNSSFEGGGSGGSVTFPAYIWAAAALDLLFDPTFNTSAPARPPRLITPDYSGASAV